MELNENAKMLVRFCPEIVNKFADQMAAQFGLEVLMASRVRTKILRPEDFRLKMETREE